jgi:ABC-2 type transport system permease protein
MLRSLVLKTVRDRRRGLLWWSVGILAYALFLGAFWPVLDESRDALESLLAAYPEDLFGLLGVANADEMFTPAGYLASQAFGWLVPGVFAVFASAMGAQLISGEEEAKTMDLLLANPLSRRRVVLDKWLGMVIVVAALGLAVLVSLLVIDTLFGFAIPFDRYAAVCTQVTLLGILFGSAALAAGALGSRRALILGLLCAFAIAAFLLNSLGSLADWVDRARVISPFYYYDSDRPLVEGFEWRNVVVLAGSSIGLLMLALWAFSRRDVRVS